MELIRTIRQKQQTARQASIQQQAEDTITVSDFDNELFIAYNGVPFVPIEKTWTSVEILAKLSMLRENFVRAKLKECGLPKIAAAL